MAVKCVKKSLDGNVKEYIGESTDTKPANSATGPSWQKCDPGSTFYELDTGDGYIWDGTQWRPA